MSKATMMISFVLLASATEAAADTTLVDALAKHGIRLTHDPSLKVIELVSRPGSTMSFETIVAHNESLHVEVEIIKPIEKKVAERYVATRQRVILNLYEDRRSPYRRSLTNLIQCPQEAKPKKRQIAVAGQTAELVLANATDANQFGACDAQSFKKRGGFVALYHPTLEAYLQIKLFVPVRAGDVEMIKQFLAALDTR